ncbi:protein spartin isoform X2 [Adelges cooleyi]|uniref:protein spartin isoform X2 n=1 Tax=Adelges cooleyi TaxID=133065 RepID=UPI0021800A1D|nr:protein spartin isoform X2 [Adelges cooleyi]
MMESTSKTNTAESCAIVRAATDKFFGVLRQARDLERQGKSNLALLEYEKCLILIDDALLVPLPRPAEPNSEWIAVENILQYLRTEKKEILNKVMELQRASGSAMVVERPIESPPSYQETIRSDEERSLASDLQQDIDVPEPPVSYSQLTSMLTDLQTDIEHQSMATVIFSCNESQVFFIPANGQVTSPSEKSIIKIFMIEGEKNTEPRCFLCIEDIYYPLVANVSPCLRTDYGAFVFPDLQTTDTSIGVLVPPEHLELFTEVLEDILKKSFRTNDSAREQGRKISAHIIKGAMYISSGLVKGAEKTTDFINNSTPGLLNYLPPSQNERRVNHKIERGVRVAKNVTSKAANVTCFVADKVGLASCALGKFLAPHVHKGGTKILTGVSGMNSDVASRQMSNALDIAAGAIEGLGIVYDGLEQSGIMLGTSIRDNTVLIVRHKWCN